MNLINLLLNLNAYIYMHVFLDLITSIFLELFVF